jgi:2-oxoglutarate dehydrogenase E1 component
VWDKVRTWPEKVTRLLLCSGKIYYDIAQSPRRAQTPTWRWARGAPLSLPRLRDRRLRAATQSLEIVWVQEEPRNMGARKFVLPKIRDVMPASVTLLDVSRPERSSPAEGYPSAHKAEQERIVNAAFGG